MSDMDIDRDDACCPRCQLTTSEPTRLSQQPSPFAQYLGTTFSQCAQLPHDAHSRLSAFIGEISTDIQAIDKEIKAMEAATQRLKDQRREAEVFLDAHKGLLCRAHDLPNEVLCKIFLGCLRPGGRYDLYGRKDLSERSAPWNIIAVCRRWRQVGCDLPHLWTGPSFKLRSSDEMKLRLDSWDGKPNRLTTALTRAKNEPLTLDVDLDCKEPHHYLSGLSDLFPRVETLYLRGHPVRYETGEILAFEDVESKNIFPNLRKLSLTAKFNETNVDRLPDDVANTVHWDILLGIVQSCPPLQELELLLDVDNRIQWAPDIHLDMENVHLVFEELKTLTLETGSLRCTALLLGQCASVTKLNLWTGSSLPEWETVSETILLPNLHTLQLDNASQVLEQLKCPALRHVNSEGWTSRTAQGIHDLLVRSGCVLESLELSINNYGMVKLPSESKWDVLPPILTGLKTLTLHLHNWDDIGVLSSFTHANVFPSLETLNLRYSHIFEDLTATNHGDADLIVERFLEACVHKQDGSRLRRLVVMFEDFPEHAAMRAFIAEGGEIGERIPPPSRESTLLQRLRGWKAEGVWVCVGQFTRQRHFRPGEDFNEIVVLPDLNTGVVQYEALV
ncbi:hypothetical protein CYLTODRAFT_426165 [Cylindrobasidium torrendii FP15055 ss-10]|uniref:Uncharacterized protein n=1 Tax=Cylindrobasidium torrendii FP15055 ss-10 TaxID=1314674 RepID=A0A0D7AZH5_9AGAR|nr:hypothetical protein CYLTODRAFT_426165 [Cylindrobasidium torrendii FP15055 ss-10]